MTIIVGLIDDSRMNYPSDTIDLFRRLKNHDLSAFNKIYNLFNRRVLNFAYSFSISLEDAEEIVQDTFIKLWKKRETIDLSKSVDVFIFVIAKNLVLNKIKQYSTDKAHLKNYFIDRGNVFDTSLEEKLNFDEIETIISRIIEELPEKRREIFKLNRFKGLTYLEISELLNISPGTVEKQMKKALETLNQKFGLYYKLVLVFFFFS